MAGLHVGFSLILPRHRRTDRGVEWECLCDCGESFWTLGKKLRTFKTGLNCGKCRSVNGIHKYGDSYENSSGECFKLLSIVDKQVTLEDDSNNIFTVSYTSFATRIFKNPWKASVAGIGYYGCGKYVAKFKNKHTKEYADWNSMLKRCYTDIDRASYKDVEVDSNWHNFQNFAEWANNQEFFGYDGYVLDKDLLVKGSKLYSPHTCCYIPSEVNAFVRRRRMNDLPLGIDICDDYDGTAHYRVQGRENGKNVYLGKYYFIEPAFMAYKTHKEDLAKILAEKWEGKISEPAYSALFNYTVEIAD